MFERLLTMPRYRATPTRPLLSARRADLVNFLYMGLFLTFKKKREASLTHLREGMAGKHPIHIDRAFPLRDAVADDPHICREGVPA
jgi:hypothetical protein